MSNQSNEQTYPSPGSGIVFLLLGLLHLRMISRNRQRMDHLTGCSR